MKISKLSKNTKEGFSWNIGLKILYEIFRFGITIYIARILDPFDFGVMAIGSMVILYTNSLSNLGFTNALVQNKNIEKEHINSVFTLNFSISVFLTTIVLSIHKWIGKLFNNPESGNVIIVLSSIIILRAFYDIPAAILKRSVNYKLISKINFLKGSISFLSALCFALLGFKYWSLVYSLVLSNVIATLVLIINVNYRPKFQYNHAKMKQIYHFGFWTFMGAQVYFLRKYLAKAIIGKFLGVVSLGYYEKAIRFSQIPRDLISMQANAVMFSTFSRIQDNKKLVGDWLNKIVLIESVVIIPLLLGLHSLSAQVIIPLLGEKWEISILPLKILSIGAIFFIFHSVFATINIGIGSYKEQTICEILIFPLEIILCLIGIKWGLAGICYSLLINGIIGFIVTLFLSKKKINISIIQLFNSLFPCLLGSCVMAYILSVLDMNIFIEKNVINLLILSIIGVFTYSSFMILFNVLLKKKFYYPLPIENLIARFKKFIKECRLNNYRI